MARTAGAALRRPAPSDGFARLQSVRRRQQIVRSSIALGSAAIVVVVGLIVLNRPSEEPIAPADSPATSTTSTTPASTTSSTTTTTIPEGLNIGYNLTGIDGLAATGDPVASDAGGGRRWWSHGRPQLASPMDFIALYESTDAPRPTANLRVTSRRCPSTCPTAGLSGYGERCRRSADDSAECDSPHVVARRRSLVAASATSTSHPNASHN